MTKLGELLGTSSSRGCSGRRYRRDIARLRTQYASRPAVSVFYQVWDQPLMTLNGEHMVSDVIELCGGRNVFAKLQPLVPDRLDRSRARGESARRSSRRRPVRRKPDTTLPALDTWRQWPRLTAVAHNNLFGIDGDLINRPAPRSRWARSRCAKTSTRRSRLRQNAQ